MNAFCSEERDKNESDCTKKSLAVKLVSTHGGDSTGPAPEAGEGVMHSCEAYPDTETCYQLTSDMNRLTKNYLTSIASNISAQDYIQNIEVTRRSMVV